MQTRLRAVLGGAALKKQLGRLMHLLGSLKLAVVLLVVLAAVIAAATVIEADRGRAYAQWFVYNSGWFLALLALLGVNIFCAALTRWPWKRHQTGFVVTHAGLLVLLTGSIQTFLSGVEGQVILVEGDTTAKLTIPHRSQITASWVGRPEEPPYEFSFDGGPVNWRRRATLDLGKIDGVAMRVLRYYPHAKAVENWVADESGTGGPMIRFKIEGPHGQASIEAFLTDQDFGDEVFVGPIRLQLQRAATDAMLGDFLDPPEELGEQGLLLAYHGDHVEHIAVAENVGKRIELAHTGAAVEIVEYLPNAKPDAHGQFRSVGEQPRNPLLELRVHLEDAKQSFRQVAFASSPLLNLDGVYDRVCPVKFQYRHPAFQPSTALELLQTSDGKLYGRVFWGDRFTSQGEVKPGSRIELPGQFTCSLVEHQVHARRKVAFEPVEVSAGQSAKPEAAVEVEVSAAGVRQSLWLQRGGSDYGARTITTPQGPLAVRLDYAEAPLGFSLGLKDFRRDTNPGRVGNASFSSLVRLVDPHREIDEERVISMNEPLTHNRLTFYQSGFNELEHGLEASTFSVAYDPGRTLKYAGSLMICLGIAVMFYMRAYFFQSVPRLRTPQKRPELVAAELKSDKQTPAALCGR